MLSNYSSYIELLAAVYTSMYIGDLFSDFWTPNYFEKLKTALENNRPTNQITTIDDLIKKNRSWVKKMKDRIKRRAVLMFFTTTFLLLLVGIEASNIENSVVIGKLYNSLILVLLVEFITYILLLRKWVFSKWKFTILSIFSLLVIGVLAYFIEIPFLSYITPYHKWIVPFVLSLITIPIIWQLFVSWLFSSAYSGYIRSKLLKEWDMYDAAKKAIEEGKRELMPREYEEALLGGICSRASTSPSDICVQHFYDRFEERLQDLCKPPQAYVMIWSWFCYKTVSVYNSLKNCVHRKSKNSVSDVFSDIRPLPIVKDGTISINYSREYAEYQMEKAKNKKLTLKVFCNDYGYNRHEMITWLRLHNNQQDSTGGVICRK